MRVCQELNLYDVHKNTVTQSNNETGITTYKPQLNKALKKQLPQNRPGPVTGESGIKEVPLVCVIRWEADCVWQRCH